MLLLTTTSEEAHKPPSHLATCDRGLAVGIFSPLPSTLYLQPCCSVSQGPGGGHVLDAAVHKSFLKKPKPCCIVLTGA